MNKEVFPIKQMYFHPELLDDLRDVAKSMTEEQFIEFFDRYDKAVRESRAEPFKNLTGYLPWLS